MKHHSRYFYGEKISDYGLENGYVDYQTLAKTFDCVLNNSIIQETYEIGYWEQESGFLDNTEEIEKLTDKIEFYQEQIEALEYNAEEKNEEYINEQIDIINGKIEDLQEQIDELEDLQGFVEEIFQYYIVSDRGAEILKEINEIVFYNDRLDMYVWGVTHYGTSWDYVLTDIEIVLDEE